MFHVEHSREEMTDDKDLRDRMIEWPIWKAGRLFSHYCW